MKPFAILLLLLGQVAPQQDDPRDQEGTVQEVRRSFAQSLRENALRMIRTTRELGNWDEHYGYMLEAVEKVYERAGWDSESDLFTLEMTREVGAIPPWNVQERFDAFAGMISDRYLLDEQQEQTLRDMIIRESNEIFARNAGRIMQYGVEAIQTRAAREPFTPEQVARWAELAGPVLEDSRRSMNRAAREFMKHLGPGQAELLQADLDAANRRAETTEEMRKRWARGEWQPADWGMDEDPIQMGRASQAEEPTDDASQGPEAQPEASASSPPEARQAEPAGEGDADESAAESVSRKVSRQSTSAPSKPAEDEWAQYVRAFIFRYELNTEQQQRAWLIHKDVKTRRDRLQGRYTRQTERLRPRAGSDRARSVLKEMSTRHKAALDLLFKQMKNRLNRLPTRAQRRAAASDNVAGQPGAASAARDNAEP